MEEGIIECKIAGLDPVPSGFFSHLAYENLQRQLQYIPGYYKIPLVLDRLKEVSGMMVLCRIFFIYFFYFRLSIHYYQYILSDLKDTCRGLRL
jgi:hypothetical protein